MRFSIKRVGDVIDEIAMGPFGSNIKVDCFVPNGIPVLNGSNLVGFTLVEKSFNYVTPEKAAALKKAVASRGDIVITHRGTLGQIVYIPANSKHEKYVISQSQFRVKCKESEILPEYMVYFFHSRGGQHQLLSNSSQVGVPALARPSSTFQELKIPVPSIREQQIIVTTLRSLNDKIAVNAKINHHLEQMAQAIYKSWFVDFEPWGGVMPNCWREAELGDVAILSAGGDKPSVCSPKMTAECIVPVFSNGIDNFGLYGYTDRPQITVESVTVSARGTIGYVCLRQEPFVPIVRLVTAIPNNIFITAKYLFLYLSSSHIAGVGTTQQQLTVPDFKKYRILVPNLDVVEDFTRTVDQMFDAIHHKREENARLAKTRDALLPRLMAGELSVAIK